MYTKTQLLHYCHSDQWCLVLRSVSTKSKKSFKLVNWIPKLVQLGQLGRPRTRSTLDPHWSSHFGPSDAKNLAFPCFWPNSGPFWSPGPKLGVPWIPRLVQIGQWGCPRTRSALDPHWSSCFALPEPENTSRGHLQLNLGHFGSFLGPPMAQNCKKKAWCCWNTTQSTQGDPIQ